MRLQIPFRFDYRESADFEHFIAGANDELCTVLQSVAIGKTIDNVYLWGPSGVGKSHLLQAVCHLANYTGLSAAFVPLSQHLVLSPEMLDGMDDLDIICIDDIDHVVGQDYWELSLFYLCNCLRESGKPLLMSGTKNYQRLAFSLADLQSRIGWGLVYLVQALSDEDKISFLQQKADSYAFQLPEQVAAYLVKHVRRDLPSLLALLDVFNQAALAEHRKLTIPFVKAVLEDIGFPVKDL